MRRRTSPGRSSMLQVQMERADRNPRNALSWLSRSEICVSGRSRRSVKNAASSSASARICFWISRANLGRLSVWVTRALDIPRCLALSALDLTSSAVRSWCMASVCFNGFPGTCCSDSKLSGSHSIEVSNPNTKNPSSLARETSEKNWTSKESAICSDPRKLEEEQWEASMSY